MDELRIFTDEQKEWLERLKNENKI